MFLLLFSFALSCCYARFVFTGWITKTRSFFHNILSHTVFSLAFHEFNAKVLLMRQIFVQFTTFYIKHFNTKKKPKKKRRQKKWIVLYLSSAQECTNAKFLPYHGACIIVSVLSSAYTFTFGFGIINLCISIFQCVNSIYMIRGRKIQKIIWKRIWYTLSDLKMNEKKIKHRTKSKTVINAFYTMLWIESAKISTIGDFSKLQLNWNNTANRLYVWIIPCTLVQLHGETECCVSVLVSQNHFSFWK